MFKTEYWTKDEIIALVERVIGGDEIGIDWDDFLLSTNSKNQFSKYWANKISAVETLYPRRKPTELFNPDGFQYLAQILDDLRSLPDDKA